MWYLFLYQCKHIVFKMLKTKGSKTSASEEIQGRYSEETQGNCLCNFTVHRDKGMKLYISNLIARHVSGMTLRKFHRPKSPLFCEMMWSCKCFINWKNIHIVGDQCGCYIDVAIKFDIYNFIPLSLDCEFCFDVVCLKYNCNFFHLGTHLNAAVMSMLKTKGSKTSASKHIVFKFESSYNSFWTQMYNYNI
jgi:hypothetical protein